MFSHGWSHLTSLFKSKTELSNFTSPQTPVKDQGGVGFCWAYSIAAHMEHLVLKKTGRAIDLSEEYLAFYTMYRQIVRLIPFFLTVSTAEPQRLDPDFIASSVKWFLSSFAGPQEGIADFSVALKELAVRGIVPESEYHVKFPEGVDGAQKRIAEFFKDKLLNYDHLMKYYENADLLRTELGDAFGLTPLREDDSFDFDGESYTPLRFMKEFIGFDPDNYEIVRVTEKNHKQALFQLRALITDGHTVPMAFAVMKDTEFARLMGIFDPVFCQDHPCRYSGWHHAVLAVNFSIEPPPLENHVLMSSLEERALTFPIRSVLIKNSWGEIGRDSGSLQAEPDSGYFDVTDEYFKEGFERNRGWSMVVPKSNIYSEMTVRNFF